VTYLGYMALANDDGETLELVNAARVKAYTDNLAPSIGLRGCDDCEGLPAALGETYTTPIEDIAPWYDPTDPATADFYGVYPLGFEGIDDSTRSIESAELTGDGSVVVGSRFAGQDIRVTGMAFAKDEAALYAGVSWLNSALNGTEDGRCFGDRLNVFSSCPPVQDLPPDFATPYNINLGDPNRINLVTDPRATDVARWAATNGTGGVTTETAITGAVDGPVIAGNPAITTYMRYTFTTGNSGGSPGFFYSHINTIPAFGPFNIGDSFAAAIYVRPSVTVPSAFTFVSQQINGADGANVNLPSATLPANVWTRIGGVGAFTAVSDTINQMGVILNTFNAPTGAVFDVVAAQVNPYQTTLGTYFDGGTTDTVTYVYDYVGGFPGRESVEVPTAAANQEASEWTTTSGSISGSGAAVNFAWTLGDPLKVACREITGLIPGQQYQLRFRPETFGNYYVSMGEDCAERYTNKMFNPRMVGLTMTTNGATVVDSFPDTGAPDGRSMFSRYVVTANTTSPFSMSLSDAGVAGIPVSPDTSYTISWYAQKLGPLGGQGSRVDWNWYDGSGVLINTNNGASNSANATFQRFTQTVLSPPTAAYMRINIVWTGTAVPGQTLNIAQTMLNVGTSAPPYIDGGSLDSRWLGAQNASASMVTRNVDYQTIFGLAWDANPPTEPTVLDFIPQTSTMYLSVQSLGVSGAPPTENLAIQQALIRRVERPGVVMFGTGNDAVPPSDGWTHLAPSNMIVEWFLQESGLQTRARNPSGGSSTYGTSHGPRRTVYGLRPGSRYRLMIQFDALYNTTGATPLAPIVPLITVSNSAGLALTYEINAGIQHYWVVEFTANTTSAVIGLSPNGNISLGTQGSATWLFNEYMVEEILPTYTVPPQPGRNQARTMYEVKASSGATVTNVRKAPCGVMAQITYGLRAGNPFKYREPVFAGGLPSGPSQVVADIPCSDTGLPQLINFAYNPSVEINATDWLAGGLNVTGSRVASATARVGGFVFRGTAPNTPGNRLDTMTAYYNTASVTGGPVPLGGDTITVSLWVRTIASTWNGTHGYIINLTMSGFPPLQATGTVNITTANQWYRVQGTFTLPFNVPLVTIEAQITTPVAITQGGGLEIDGYQIERGSVATSPWDQTFPNTEYSGAVGSSALLRDVEVTDISADPDCPTPPAPPLPPEIDDACVDVPTTYNRTVVSILDNTVPRNLTAYPVITLTAGATAVRQARIRFWENPNNLLISQLDPCSYEGEIVVSYLAAGATMVIDGVLQEATVSLTGFETQNANHVLYGPDGGPVEWPELSGGIPYLVTLELDSSAPYTDTLMLIDLVVRD